MILIFMLQVVTKGSCLPGSMECSNNMLRICDLNGLWIQSDCVNDTECSIDEGNVGCLPSTKDDNGNKPQKENVVDQLLNKDFEGEEENLRPNENVGKSPKEEKNNSLSKLTDLIVKKLKRKLKEDKNTQNEDDSSGEDENSDEKNKKKKHKGQNRKDKKKKQKVKIPKHNNKKAKTVYYEKRKPKEDTKKDGDKNHNKHNNNDSEGKPQDNNKSKSGQNNKDHTVTVTKIVSPKDESDGIDVSLSVENNDMNKSVDAKNILGGPQSKKPASNINYNIIQTPDGAKIMPGSGHSNTNAQNKPTQNGSGSSSGGGQSDAGKKTSPDSKQPSSGGDTNGTSKPGGGGGSSSPNGGGGKPPGGGSSSPSGGGGKPPGGGSSSPSGGGGKPPGGGSSSPSGGGAKPPGGGSSSPSGGGAKPPGGGSGPSGGGGTKPPGGGSGSSGGGGGAIPSGGSNTPGGGGGTKSPSSSGSPSGGGSKPSGGASSSTKSVGGSSSSSSASPPPSNGSSQKQSSGDKAQTGDSKQSSAGGGDKKSTDSTSQSSGDKKSSSSSASGGGGGAVNVTADQITQAMTENSYAPKPEYVEAIVKVTNDEFKSLDMAAMFLAQTGHESGGFQYIEEVACAGSNKCADQYGGSQGVPGKSYHGRGFIQLSWPANYKEAGQALGMGDELYENPEKVAEDPEIGAKVSSWFWKTKVETAPGVSENKFGATTKAINGALECTGSNVDKSKNRYKVYKSLAKVLDISNLADEGGCY